MGEVSLYVQSHIPVKLREDLMRKVVEVLWLQVHLSGPFFWGANISHQVLAVSIWIICVCEMLDSVCDVNREVYFMGDHDLNIDWFSSSRPLKRNLLTVTIACNLVQVIIQPTKVFTTSTGTISSMCFGHIFTNAAECCSEASSAKIGCSDHRS
jgi:hypothetical protein